MKIRPVVPELLSRGSGESKIDMVEITRGHFSQLYFADAPKTKLYLYFEKSLIIILFH